MIARSLGQMEAVSSRIREKYSIEPFIYPCDLTNTGELERTFNQLLQEHEQIDCLINNAGVGKFDSVLEMNEADLTRMFQLNVFAMISTIQYMLPHFRKNGAGHIVNIASQAGKIATPKSSGYCASKHAILGYTNVLRQEAREMGIYVTAANFGPVQTSFFETADPGGDYARNVAKFMLDPEIVARKVIGLLFTKKRELNMPRWMELGSKLYQLLPGPMELVLKRQFNKK